MAPERAPSDQPTITITASAAGKATISAMCDGKLLGCFSVKAITLKLPLLIAWSERRPGFNADATVANDMKYGDYTENQIKAISWKFTGEDLYRDMATTGAKVYFEKLRRMATTLFSVGALQKNIEGMIDQFQARSGSDYTNTDLNAAVRDHGSTKRFVEQIRGSVDKGLRNARGDLNALAAPGAVTLTGRPVFHDKADIISGLTIAINDTWAYDVYIEEFALSGSCWTGKFRLVLWDHFGLDQPDVEDSQDYNWLNGFRAWFILPHLDRFGYRPFKTRIELPSLAFSGNVS